ncbi:hypothetical protein MLD38_008987 [Melastoma candidum]|uniref:Uncharacterized protein n=1 Tax=Melastoma candidum TaxID=119954 RepID=A0ACB9RWA3_9MYRT|nr:hypothetical protein MLD38_008987 [Melastoma candidum]
MNPSASRAAATLVTLLVAGLSILQVFSDERLLVNMTIVQNASAIGAYCLDGSLPAYHLHRGFGAGADNWLLQFEGGGWCNDIGSCLERAKTRRGSPVHDPVRGLLRDPQRQCHPQSRLL